MMLRNLLNLTFVLLSFSLSASVFAADHSYQDDSWESFNSCNQIGKILENLPLNNLESSPSSKKSDTLARIVSSDPQSFLATDYLALHQKAARLILLAKSPHSSLNPVMNLTTPEIFGMIRFSPKFSLIQTDRYEDLLIITAYYEEKTLMMIYRIDEKKIIPVKYFQIQWVLLDSKIIQNKFYFATQRTYSPWEIEDYRAGKQRVNELIPHFLEDKDFLKITAKEQEIDCRMVKFPDQNLDTLGASFISVITVDLKALNQGSQVASFFGNVEKLIFEDKFMYGFYHLDQEHEKMMVLDQFVLEPVIKYMKSYQTLGTLLSPDEAQNLTSQKLLGLVYTGSSKLLKIDEQFGLFNNLQDPGEWKYFFDKKWLYLVEENAISLQTNYGGNMLALGTITYAPEEQLWYPLASDADNLIFLTIGEKNNRLYFKKIQITLPDLTTCTENTCAAKPLAKIIKNTAYYPGQLAYDLAEFVDLSFFSPDKTQFYFPLKLTNWAGELIFNGIKSLKIPGNEQEKFQEQFARNYQFYLKDRSISTLNHGGDFLVVSAPRWFDLFVPTAPQKMKLLGY